MVAAARDERGCRPPCFGERQLVGGGRYSVGFDEVLDRRTGRRMTLSGLPVAYDRARPRVFVLVTSPVAGVAVVVWAVLCAACVALVLMHRQRLLSVVLVGVVGLATSLVFVGFSAPDLALTQLSVEVVSTVLLLMGEGMLLSHNNGPASAVITYSRPWRRKLVGLMCKAV